MRKLIALSAAIGAAPIVAFAVMQTAAPAFADTPGVSPTCFPQSANPHPTDPAGQTTNTLFCTPTNPNGSGSGGSGTGGSGSGGRTAGTSAAGTTAGGGQTSPADSTASGSSGSGAGMISSPDESARFNWAPNNNAGKSGTGQPATGTDSGIFGGLVGFFSTAGGLALLFGLLMLMLLVLVAIAVAAAFRRGPAKDWGEHFSRVTHRA